MNVKSNILSPLTLVFALLSLVLFSYACSNFYGGATNSQGNQSITESPTVITFEADVGSTLYKTVTFTNRSGDNYEITNLAFVDNDCGAFSVYNILDSSGNILYQSGQTLSVGVIPGETVAINLRFSPTECEVTEYTTTFIIFYQAQDETQAETVSLEATVTDNTPDAAICDKTEPRYYDEFDNPTERTLPVLDSGKKYYIRVDKLSAYIQTTGGFSAFATQVGTNINLDDIPEEDRYVPVYLSFTTDEAGNVFVDEIDACVGFDLPSPTTDPFFLGAPMSVTTAGAFTGTIDRQSDPGHFEIPGVVFHLASFINNSNSLLQDPNGFFEVNIEVDLTTGETANNEFLENLTELTDDNGEVFFNIANGALVGKNIRHGTITLVGIATFLNDDDAKMSDEGKQAILENEAYLFLQIEGLITQALD